MDRCSLLQNVETYIQTELGLSKTTQQAYLYDIKEFLTFAKEEKLTAGLVEKYINYLENKNLKRNTIRRKVMSVRCLYNYLFSLSLIRIDELKSIPSFKGDICKHIYMDQQSIYKLLSVLRGNNLYRNISIMLLMYHSGLRVSEVCALKTVNVLFNTNTIRVNGKGNKDRYVPTTDQCIKSIQQYLNQKKYKSDYLFTDQHNTPLSRHTISDMIRSAGVRVGYNISSHVLRRSCATSLFDRGMDVDSIKKLLGHSDLSTTHRYISISNDQLMAVFNKYHPFGANNV